jgi:hypothetical protein
MFVLFRTIFMLICLFHTIKSKSKSEAELEAINDSIQLIDFGHTSCFSDDFSSAHRQATSVPLIGIRCLVQPVNRTVKDRSLCGPMIVRAHISKVFNILVFFNIFNI